MTEQGGRHGEVVALDAAGAAARGATLYVTLEPCNHHGTTPPCSERIVADGIARVVVGARDPNPEAGGGIETLRDAGVEVELLDAWEARVQNEAWRVWVSRGRPFVTYKVAATLDGRVTVPGRRWVTGEESRRLVHELRGAVAMRSRSGWGPCGRTRRGSTPATCRRRAGSRAGLRSAAARCPRARSSSCARARSRTSCALSPPRASSRSCSKAARRSPEPSSTPAWSTSCCSSSRP